MKRTGSIASRVPPAVTTMCRPVRSASRAADTSGGRAAGSAARTGTSPMAATTASTMNVRSARRPTPDCPDARGPESGSTTTYPKLRKRATFAVVAGWVHMSPSIAGATTTGAEVARQVAVTTSPASPLAIAPSQCAVAGATTMASAASPIRMWPIRPSGRRSSSSVSTGWRESAANDRAPTKRVAVGVSMTATSAPSARRRRSSSTALYAAIEPVTPSPIRRPASRPAGRRSCSTVT